MGPWPLSSAQKQPYGRIVINKSGFRHQIGRNWIEINSRFPHMRIQWEQVLGQCPLEMLRKQYFLTAYFKTSITCFIWRDVARRWEDNMRQLICFLAKEKTISLMTFAEPRGGIRIIGKLNPVQSLDRPRNQSFIKSPLETLIPQEENIQQFLINKQEIVRKIPVQSRLQPDALKYLLYLTHSNRSKRMKTNIILTLELQDPRIDGLNHLMKIILNQQQKLLEQGFAALQAAYQAWREQESLMETELLQYIHEICERNQPVKAQLAHFLIPYGIILRMMQLKCPPYRHSLYINGLIGYILGQMRREEIRGQLGERVRASFLQMLTEEEVSYQEIKDYLKMLLIDQKRPMSEIVPFYYNFFALLINQEAYFQGGNREDLLEYTIQLEIPFFNRDQVGWKEIFGVIQLMEIGLRKRYHSQYV